MKKELRVLTIAALALCMTLSCKLGFNHSIKDFAPVGGKTITIVCDIPEAAGARSVNDDPSSLDSVVVTATNAGGAAVGSATLTKVGGVWSGALAVSEYGTLTFAARALDLSSTRLRYSGSKSSLVSAATTSISVPVAPPTLWFVKQALADATDATTATLAGGNFAVHNNYPAANAFVYTAASASGPRSDFGNFNGFLALPTPLGGAFTVKADVKVTNINKGANSNGIGVGLFSGFQNTDTYGLYLLRNGATTGSGGTITGNCFYSKASSVGTSSNGALSAAALGSTYTLEIKRDAASIYWRYYLQGATPGSFFSAGTSNFYGLGGNVYVGVTFANVDAAVSSLSVVDASGLIVYDSAVGAVEAHIPATITASIGSKEMSLADGATTFTAVARADGGAIVPVTVASSDPSLATIGVASDASGSTITVTPLRIGAATLTLTNSADSTKARTVSLAVNTWTASDSYGTLPANFFPARNATGVYADGEYALTFDNAPTLNAGGSFKIYNTSGTLVDSIYFSGESQTTWGTVVNVDDQLVRVDGNTVYFTPHFGKLAASTAYYVAIPNGAITATFNGYEFKGFTNVAAAASWKFTTRAAPALAAATTITVDNSQTSTANFRTIQGALDYIVACSAADITIAPAAGTYRELIYYKGSKNITIAGPAGNTKGDTCVIQYKNGNSLNGSTHTRAVFYVNTPNLVLKNITIKNTAVRATLAQSEALYFASGAGKTLAAYNCSFISNQDTIQSSGRNWFYSCYIEGNVDFIWGNADAALFENCSLRVVNDVNNGAYKDYAILVARTGTTIAPGSAGTVGKGYVLLNSTVAADNGVLLYFGRDAGAGSFYDQVALINVAFSASGQGVDTALPPVIAAGIWNTSIAPLGLAVAAPAYVGWKAAGCSGLNFSELTTAAGTSTTIAGQATEYDTRAHILNRVVAVDASGAATGYADATTSWDTSALATAFGAP